MGSNQFQTHLIVRVILIVLSSLFLAYAVFRYNDGLLIANLIVIIVIQSWLLIRYINKTNTDLANFFLSVQFDDTSIKFQKKKYGNSFDRVYKNLEALNNKFKLLRVAEEKQTRFLSAIADHVRIGIVVFDDEGNIELSNQAALDLFNLPYLKNLNQLSSIQHGLADKLMQTDAATREVITLEIGDAIKKILVRTNEYKLLDRSLKIISLQDIISELDEQEVDSWQKLIRILSHEIMNSVGPIKSSIETIGHLLLDRNTGLPLLGHELSEDTLADIVQGIEIVKERSIGMSEFVEQFRSFTLLPKPELRKVKVTEVVNSIKFLFQAEFEKYNIEFNSHIPNANMVLYADANMVEQMLINMIHNAIQANATVIEIQANRIHESKVCIDIIDNGNGIDEANIDQIFIPFFTTKSTGTGVGLSLARQIMRYHHGSIKVNSRPGVRTVFKITF